MPPFGFRKRERSSSPLPSKGKTPTPKRANPTLFETADAPSEKQTSLEDNNVPRDDVPVIAERALGDKNHPHFADVVDLLTSIYPGKKDSKQ